jgi:hypothetical protein
MRSTALGLMVLIAAGCKGSSTHGVTPNTTPEPPRWHFDRVAHGLGALTLTGVYGRSDGAVFAVGWAGTIITNRKTKQNPDGTQWTKMASGVTVNLTGIAGVENGTEFGLASDADGEMFAVGWSGTLLHYHPNPDNDPLTDDGAWQVVSAPGGSRLVGRLKTDPACPDYDGDGFADDGDGDGFWGNAPCAGGAAAACDDNCRTTANGNQRPFADVDNNGCVGPGDTVQPAATWQADADLDGVGDLCDADSTKAVPTPGFELDLFAVAATPVSGGQVLVVAVGGDGSLVSYRGPDGAQAVLAPALPITDPHAWTAQDSLAFRYDDDCPAGTPAGQTCDNGRLPPACPAMCNPMRTTCDCQVGQGQCCDAAGTTGAGCVDGSCGPAANACAGGNCSTFCPECFRRLDQTLRGVAIDGATLLVVGARGMILQGSAVTPTDVWSAPTCTPTPPPLDAGPLMTAVSASNGSFKAVGSDGALVTYPGGGCVFEAIAGNTAAFLSGVHATGDSDGYVVGDKGTLLRLSGGAITALDPKVGENLLAVTSVVMSVPTISNGDPVEHIWVVGASGTLLDVAYY